MASAVRAHRRRVLLVALATAAAVALAGCGDIQERKQRADRVIDSVDRATAAGSARMTISVEPHFRHEQADALLAASGGQDSVTPLTAEVDLARDRAAFVVAQPDGTRLPTLVYAGTAIYARRPNAAASPQPAGARSRPWVHLELTSIDPDEIDDDGVTTDDALRRVQQTLGVDNPLFLIKLLRGALSGSVDDVGREDVAGTPTTHYELNIDREKAVDDESEEVQDAYEALFKSIFATRTVFPGEVWLDDDGLPRRFAVTLKSNVRRRALVDLRVTVELADLGSPVQVDLPDKAETSKVEGLGGLAVALGRDA